MAIEQVSRKIDRSLKNFVDFLMEINKLESVNIFYRNSQIQLQHPVIAVFVVKRETLYRSPKSVRWDENIFIPSSFRF